MANNRIPPQNIEAEKAVLCCCLLSKSALEQSLKALKVDDFYFPAHSLIFGAFVELDSMKTPIDMITVSDILKIEGTLETVGGTQYIGKLTDLTVIVQNVSKYIEIVQNMSIRRKVVSTLDKALSDAYDAETDSIDSINRVVDELKANRNNTEETGLVDIATYYPTVENRIKIPTGFEIIDYMTNGLAGGMYTVITGKRGNGKSTLASQIVLTAVNEGFNVGFYSGELTKEMFQEWLFSQAAGTNNIEQYEGENGAIMFRANDDSDTKIRRWLSGKLYLYDNEIVRSNENNTIIDRFSICAEKYNCKLFFVDNLKSARFKVGGEKDYYRKQAEFVKDLLAFCLRYKVHVILMAHPNKSNGEDISDGVEGSSDITDLAGNVWKIDRLEGREKQLAGADAVITIAKNRDCGKLGRVLLKYDIASRRYTSIQGKTKYKYHWED